MWTSLAFLLLLAAQAPDYNGEGIKALDAKNYQQAVEDFTKAIAADASDYTAHFNLAFAYSMLDKDAAAIPEYRKVLELKPGLYQAELNLGIVLLRQKQPEQALPLLEAAAKEKPGVERTIRYLGEAHLEMARTLAQQDRLPEAAEQYRKAGELDPQLKSYLLELAARYEAHKQADQAIAIYREYPKDAGARERLGELLLESGRPQEAIPELEQAVAQSPTAANRVALAMAYLKAQHPDKALPLLEAAARSEPGNFDLKMIYGRALRDQKKYAPAAQQFLEVIKAKPDFLDGWKELSGMLISLENYPEALAALDRVKALGGETTGQLYLRAIVLDKTRQLKEALASYEKFLAASGGKFPEEEFKARQRVRIIRNEISRR